MRAGRTCSCWLWCLLTVAPACALWRELPPLPTVLGVAGAFAGVTGDALVVGGGANFPVGFPWQGGTKVWHDAVYLLDSPNGTWRTLPPLPGPRAYGVSLTTDRGVLCLGGSDSQRHYAECYRLRWTGQTLEREALPDLPQPVANACGALVGTVAYVAGGEASPGATAALNTLWALDLDAPLPRWRTLPPCPGGARSLAAAGAVDGNFCLCGGVELSAGADGKPQRRYRADTWLYSPGGEWRRVADLPHPLAAPPSPAALVDGQLLLPGGDDGSKLGFQPVERHPGFNAEVLAFDPRANAWTVVGRTPAPRATAPLVVWRGAPVVVSGEVRPGVRSPQVWLLETAR